MRTSLKSLASLHISIWAMGALMVLVLGCTLAQPALGLQDAVDSCMRSWFLWTHPVWLPFPIPYFPGGILVGLALLVNLSAALVLRVKNGLRDLGLIILHAGLVLLIAGEFISGALQQETRMVLAEGHPTRYLESAKDMELAFTNLGDPSQQDWYSIPAGRLSKGSLIALPGDGLSVKVHTYLPSAEPAPRQDSDPIKGTEGVGLNNSVRPCRNGQPAAFVEPFLAGRSCGVWLVSPLIDTPQTLIQGAKSFAIQLRPRIIPLPYTLTLQKFTRELHPGADIPKAFSSRVRLDWPERKESREVLISMNQPLRFEGRAFYQASFAEQDTVSILQVVENPGWLLPYLSCTLVSIGLLIHFLRMLAQRLKQKDSPALDADRRTS